MIDLPEFTYLREFIHHRLDQHFHAVVDKPEPEMPEIDDWSLLIPEFFLNASLDKEEWVLLLLSLSPHIQSNFLDDIIQNSLSENGDFPQLGGVRGKNFRGFLPTGETGLFLLAGNDLSKRKKIQSLFSSDHFFGRHQILWLEDSPEGEPRMSGKIVVSQEYVEILTLGKANSPAFSMKFPARIIETELEWDDLVFADETQKQIKELKTWLTHGNTLLDGWGMRKRLKPGYRVLFHGPPGTGKTLTASLLGKHTGKDVYKIDLSMVVSKFIGETEKNLANLLAKAEKTGNILFFDEADALFGKRTHVRDAHDKYANQEVSYLLQRIETYNGLVILASNLKSNIDDSFIRRFQAIIHFPLPGFPERLKIWSNAFPAKTSFHSDVDLVQIAQKYELSGADIMNIVQYACLKALEHESTIISDEYIADGIRREYLKGGRILR